MATLSASVEALVRSRRARLVLALTLLVLAGWALLPHLAYRIAPSAFVNAELVRVTAPMAGRLANDLPRKGDMIDRSITVNLTETLAPDRRHLWISNSKARSPRIVPNWRKRQLAESTTVDQELATRTDAYQDGMVRRIGQEIAEAEADKTGCLAEAFQRRDIGSRMDELVKSGYASPIRSAEASATEEANAARCQMADARI